MWPARARAALNRAGGLSRDAWPKRGLRATGNNGPTACDQARALQARPLARLLARIASRFFRPAIDHRLCRRPPSAPINQAQVDLCGAARRREGARRARFARRTGSAAKTSHPTWAGPSVRHFLCTWPAASARRLGPKWPLRPHFPAVVDAAAKAPSAGQLGERASVSHLRAHSKRPAGRASRAQCLPTSGNEAGREASAFASPSLSLLLLRRLPFPSNSAGGGGSRLSFRVHRAGRATLGNKGSLASNSARLRRTQTGLLGASARQLCAGPTGRASEQTGPMIAH